MAFVGAAPVGFALLDFAAFDFALFDFALGGFELDGVGLDVADARVVLAEVLDACTRGLMLTLGNLHAVTVPRITKAHVVADATRQVQRTFPAWWRR